MQMFPREITVYFQMLRILFQSEIIVLIKHSKLPKIRAANSFLVSSKLTTPPSAFLAVQISRVVLVAK